MLQRCRNENDAKYRHYGGRGIRVCERWLTFENFLADMGPRPAPGLTIDRFPDNNGNYEPGNCRWATMREQQNNRRNNHVVEHGGRRQTVMQWSREKGWPFHVLSGRLDRGMSPDDALSEPFYPKVPTRIEFNGESLTISEWAERVGIERRVLTSRLLRDGLAPSEAFRVDYKRTYDKKHGHASVNGKQSPEYRLWHHMVDSCTRVGSAKWRPYGGRGVTLCDDWRDFRNFLRDMGARPSSKHGLRLADGALIFGPGTVTWGTRAERARRNSRARLVTFRGETMTTAEWARRTGLSFGTLKHRLASGVPLEEALTTPSRKTGRGGLAA